MPKLPHVLDYLARGCSPGGAQRNFDSYGYKISPLNQQQQALLCDPQTSGGLLVAVRPQAIDQFLKVTSKVGLLLQPIGETIEATTPLIEVR